MGSHRLSMVAAWVMPLAVLSQIGFALFGIPLVVHALLGVLVGVLALLLAWVLPAGMTSRSQRVLAIVLVGLLGLQPCFIALRSIVPPLAAAHEINAFVILAVSCAFALDVEGEGPDSAVTGEVGGRNG